MKKREKKVSIRAMDVVPEMRRNASLYLFDEDGKLMEWAPLASGEATLKSKPEAIEGITRMIVGPVMPAEFDFGSLNAEKLLKLGGVEFKTRLTPNFEILIKEIPRLILPPFRKCLVTGHVTKNFMINGALKEIPICNARVHICEVDRKFLLFPKIPPVIIDDLGRRLKDILKKWKVKKPFPFPPGPDPDPWMVAPVNNLLKSENTSFRTVTSLPKDFKLPELPREVQAGLVSKTTSVVTDTISKNFQLLHPYICLWPHFWPYFYTCDEIATVYTNNAGEFNYRYFNPFQRDDIYVWVEVFINGLWKTVYRPPMPCGTRWDYVCGTDILIKITDSRVTPGCQIPPPGEIVWFRSIGEYATALHIEQDIMHSVTVQAAPFRNVGCTDVLTDAAGNRHRISPFGRTLYFKLMFGDAFPNSTITHYRWKKTRTHDAALVPVVSPVTTVVGGNVYKYYYIITTDIFGHHHFGTKAVLLGAEGSGENIGYRIPKWDIKSDPGVPAADKLLTIQWTSPDFWSAALDSNGLSDGLWRFDLELLKKNAAGNFVVVNVPKQVFQVTKANDYGTSVNAPDEYLKISPLMIFPPRAEKLTLKVRIDNAHCHADIHDATITIDGVTYLSGPCGFLKYTDPVNQKVKISFEATHPRNFGLFHFRVVKGNGSEAVPATLNQDGYLNNSAGDYILSGGEYAQEEEVAGLKGSCPQAAFVENLYIRSLATNGTRFLWEYDASDSNAFAVSNT